MKKESYYNFDYFYKEDLHYQRDFLMPKVLLVEPIFKDLSIDSKILYSILLDRASFSYKNNWLDDKNRIYIYFSVSEIMEKLQCASQKAAKLIKQLVDFGLIEKRQQGLGKPDIIYVKSCFKVRI